MKKAVAANPKHPFLAGTIPTSLIYCPDSVFDFSGSGFGNSDLTGDMFARPILDFIGTAAVPEPGTLALFASGFGEYQQ